MPYMACETSNTTELLQLVFMTSPGSVAIFFRTYHFPNIFLSLACSPLASMCVCVHACRTCNAGAQRLARVHEGMLQALPPAEFFRPWYSLAFDTERVQTVRSPEMLLQILESPFRHCCRLPVNWMLHICTDWVLKCTTHKPDFGLHQLIASS